MNFDSDEGTLVDVEPNQPSSSKIPANDYLWISPTHCAYPGWHHRLILHLLSFDNRWKQQSGFDFSSTKLYLSEHYPQYMMPDHDIGAIAREYLGFQKELKAAYRGMVPGLPHSRHNLHADLSTADVSGFDLGNETLWQEVFDPSIFEQAEAELMAEFGQKTASAQLAINKEQQFVASTNGSTQTENIDEQASCLLDADFRSDVKVKGGSNFTVHHPPKAFTHGADEARDKMFKSDNEYPELVHDCEISPPALPNIAQSDLSLPVTPTRALLSPKTPPKPRSKRFFSPSNTDGKILPREDSPCCDSLIQQDRIKSAMLIDDADIAITEENAKFYAPLYLAALVDSKQVKNEDFEDTGMAAMDSLPVMNNEPSTNRTHSTVNDQRKCQNTVGQYSCSASRNATYVETNKTQSTIRPPNPQSYIQTSRNHWTIPASEAVSFIAWWKPSDPIPAKIEGAFWYCEHCYNPKPGKNTAVALSEGGKALKVVRGKFSTKRSVEKHYHDTHKQAWKPTLPELEGPSSTMIEPLLLPAALADVNEQSCESSEVQNHHELSQSQFTECGEVKKTNRSPLLRASSPSLNVDENFSYRPVNVRRKLFQEELGTRKRFNEKLGGNKCGEINFRDLDMKTNKALGQEDRQVAQEGRTGRGSAGGSQQTGGGRVSFASMKVVQVFDEDLPTENLRRGPGNSEESQEKVLFSSAEKLPKPKTPLKINLNVSRTDSDTRGRIQKKEELLDR